MAVAGAGQPDKRLLAVDFISRIMADADGLFLLLVHFLEERDAFRDYRSLY